MTIIQKFKGILKKNKDFFSTIQYKNLKIQNFNSIIVVFFLIFFSGLFFISSNLINIKNKENENNLSEITKNNEFSNITSFIISKINSPYEEINYVIKNNDTIEKILKRFKVNDTDIKNISIKLKQKKLANIYSGENSL